MEFTEIMDLTKVKRFKQSDKYNDMVNDLMGQFIETTNASLKKYNLQANPHILSQNFIDYFANNLIDAWEEFKKSDDEIEIVKNFGSSLSKTGFTFHSIPMQPNKHKSDESESDYQNMIKKQKNI